MIDKSMSLEKYLELDPRTKGMAKTLTTNMLKQILPDVHEQYGDRKQFDLLFSMSHNLLQGKLDGSRVTGFNLDKNGNFRFTLNIYSQLLIDKSMKMNKNWVNVREIFLGLTYKGKLVVKETKPGEKTLLLVSKSAEVSNVKILNEEGEEVVVEQMMITSGLNV